MDKLKGFVHKALRISHIIGRYAPKHIFPMRTTFRNCFLVNFSMEPNTLRGVLPPGLSPDLYNGKAFVSIVVSDLQDMRIGYFSRLTGFDYTQIVYRAIVRAPNGERGVYFIRSDANSAAMSIAGSLFSNFNFNLASILWQGKENLPLTGIRGSLDDDENSNLSKEIISFNKKKIVHFALEPWRPSSASATIRASYDLSSASLTMPPSSAFSAESLQNAQKFFVELYAAFASWPLHDQWTAVRIDRTKWNIVCVDHLSAAMGGAVPIYSFMQDSKTFPPGACTIDSVFYVHDLDYHWHTVEKHPRCVADAVAAFGRSRESESKLPQSKPPSPPVRTTMFYDGSCPLCTKEVSHYMWLSDWVEHHTGKRPLDFVDISSGDADLLESAFGVDANTALLRLHVVDQNGILHTGTRAFVALWLQLPVWKYLGYVIKHTPLAVSAVEILYVAFLKWRASWHQTRAGKSKTDNGSALGPGASCRIDGPQGNSCQRS